MIIHCVKHLAGTLFLLHQSEENFVSFLNLLLWTLRMSPLRICPWFVSVNGDVVQLQGKLFILCKMSLVPNVYKFFMVKILRSYCFS